jgi:hypothetical protein
MAPIYSISLPLVMFSSIVFYCNDRIMYYDQIYNIRPFVYFEMTLEEKKKTIGNVYACTSFLLFR